MARVTMKGALVNHEPPAGFRMFSFEEGKTYHMIFIGDEFEGVEHPVLYSGSTHNVSTDRSGFETRCASKFYNDEADVVRRDSEGNLINDGTCPYCEARKIEVDGVFRRKDKFVEENPGATDQEIKKFLRDEFKKVRINEPRKRIVAVVAVIEVDPNTLKPMTDKDGNVIYEIKALKLSELQFEEKLLQAFRMSVMDKENPENETLAWKEFYFRYPEAGSKGLSAQGLTISDVRAPLLEKETHAELKERLEKEVSEIDFDELEESIFVLRLKTLAEMNSDIEAYVPLEKDTVTEEDIESALDELGEDKSVLGAEAAAGVIGVESEEKAEAPKGADAFDVDKLL